MTDGAKTATYTATATDFSSPAGLAFRCTAYCTLTLPATAPTTGGFLTVQNESNWPMLIDPNGNQLSGIAWTKPLPGRSGIFIRSDGTNYHLIGSTDSLGNTFRHVWRGLPSDGVFDYIWDFAGKTGNRCDGVCNELAPTTTNPIRWQLITSATANSMAYTSITQGDIGVGNATKPSNLEFRMWAQLATADCTSKRMWIGWLGGNGQTMATQMGTDTLSSGLGGAAFRCSSGSSDTTWQCVNSNASAQTVTSTALTLDTAMHLFEVRMDDVNAKVLFMVDGAVVCGGAKTTNIPPANAEPFAAAGITTLTTAAKTFNLSAADVSSFQ